MVTSMVRSDHKTLLPLTTPAPPLAHVQLITLFDPRMSPELRLSLNTRIRSDPATTGEWSPHTDHDGGLTHWSLVTQSKGGAPGRIDLRCQQTVVVTRMRRRRRLEQSASYE